MSLKSRQTIQRLLRQVGLLRIADRLRYLVSVVRRHRRNQAFRAAHPEFELPPNALAYDAYSAPDWTFYYRSGFETATFLANIIVQQLPDTAGAVRILEWGCGPARVVRHLRTALNKPADIVACDYNAASIAWCAANIPDVRFFVNGLEPPLPFESGFFSFIYAISVLTHLSESVGRAWLVELYRILRPGGVAVLTTNGDSMQSRLFPVELKAYRNAEMVVRGKVEEGKRCFVAYHPPAYAEKQLFKQFQVLKHAPGAFPYTGQDYWVLKRQ